MTAPQEEWTEWFQHDGKGCPCVGKMVEVVRANGDVSQFIAGRGESYKTKASFSYLSMNTKSWWDWASDKPVYGEIIRYRLKKPRALLDLIQLIADLPAPVAPIKTDGVIA